MRIGKTKCDSLFCMGWNYPDPFSIIINNGSSFAEIALLQPPSSSPSLSPPSKHGSEYYEEKKILPKF